MLADAYWLDTDNLSAEIREFGKELPEKPPDAADVTDISASQEVRIGDDIMEAMSIGDRTQGTPGVVSKVEPIL